MSRRILFSPCLILLTVATSLNGEPAEKPKPDSAPLTPDLERCQLRMGNRALKPVGPALPYRGEPAPGGFRILIEKGAVRAFKGDGEKPQWSVKIPAQTGLARLASDEKVLYFAGYSVDPKTDEWTPEAPARVRRLDLTRGEWLEHLPIDGKVQPKETQAVQSVLADGGRVVVLTGVTDEEHQLLRYRVSCFRAGEVRPLWAHEFPSAGTVDRPGVALLWAARSPEKAQPDVQHLSWLGRDVLVCAGQVQDLLCLEAATGKERWRVGRVWEFERGFIGPSVWQHFIARGGRRGGAGGGDGGKATGKDAKTAGRHYGIVGGPVVVETPKKAKEGAGTSVFVAVAKGPAQYAAYLADCVVYELDARGEPLAMTTLPRIVRGGAFRVLPNGLVWACQARALVKLAPSAKSAALLGFGPGGPDCLCQVAWYRQHISEKRGAWLRADPAGDPLAFGDSQAFRVTEGGYIEERGSGVYHFPISMIDLGTGLERRLVLEVPFKGSVPEPKTNFSQSSLPDGSPSWHAYGPYLLAITRLQVEGPRLRITLGMEQWSRTLDFALEAGPG